MLKCCGCQTNFILSLGGSFLFSKNFLPTPSLTGGLVMPIRRTIQNPIGITAYGVHFIYYVAFATFDCGARLTSLLTLLGIVQSLTYTVGTYQVLPYKK